MSDHQTPENLSALLEGDLPEAEAEPARAHLAVCARCREVLAALETTVVEMRALDAPAPTQQESWALRAAIASARRRPARATRWILASGSAAAALVAIVGALSLGAREEPAREGGAALEAAPGAAREYTRDELRALLETAGPEAFAADSADTTDGEGTKLNLARGADADTSVRCEREAKLTGRPRLHAEEALFEGTPVYVLMYEGPHGRELWVLRRTDCYTMLFLQ